MSSIFARYLGRHCAVGFLFIAVGLIAFRPAQAASTYTFNHFAGALDGANGFIDGTGTAARMNSPVAVALDSAGNLYVCDGSNYTVRKISPAGAVTTIAGAVGQPGSVDGSSAVARFNVTEGIAVDQTGNVYVSDWGNSTIRKITSSGVVSTFAGMAQQPGSADGIGVAAQFKNPAGLAIDSAGNLYVADFGNNRIRKITPGGVVSTLAGSTMGYADGTGTAARFNGPYGVAVDSGGTVYVADSGNSVIRVITPGGAVTTIAGIASVIGSSDGIGYSARFAIPMALCVDNGGNIFITDSGNQTVRKMTPDRNVVTIGGSPGVRGRTDGQGALALFSTPSAIAVDTSGTLYIADSLNNAIRQGLPVADTSGTPSAPVIVSPPASQTAVIGGSITFAVEAQNADGYKWVHETPQGPTIVADGPSPNLTITPVVAASGGNYYVVVRGPGGTVQSSTVTLTVTASAQTPVKLTNISTRSFVGTNGDVLIAGFIISGGGPKTVLIRASGPALTQFGVPGVLSDPVLKVYAGETVIGSNDNWSDDPTVKAANLNAFQTLHTFGWDNGSKDAALVLTLNPGGYTAIVSGNNGATGVSLIEVYEVDVANLSSHLVNISSRSLVKIDADVQIAGFIISGGTPKKVIIRASGPALTKYGVPGVLADPTLEVYNGQTVIASNDNWDSAVRGDFQKINADNWDTGSKDAALVLTLNPGGYTAIVRGKNNTSGVALIEVFEED